MARKVKYEAPKAFRGYFFASLYLKLLWVLEREFSTRKYFKIANYFYTLNRHNLDHIYG